jgi:hypothetical protein
MTSIVAGRLAARLDPVVPVLELRVPHEAGIAGDDLIHGAHGVGVVGDHEPIEGPGEFDALAVGGRHLIAPGEAEGFLGAEDHAEGTGVEGV